LDTAVLVGALGILFSRVECVGIYVISFIHQHYRGWSYHQVIKLI
jgi:hypothetical protein